MDDLTGPALMADGLSTMLAGKRRRFVRRPYARTSVVMAATRVLSDGRVSDRGWRVPDSVDAAEVRRPDCDDSRASSAVRASVLYGMIGMLGVRIWAEPRGFQPGEPSPLRSCVDRRDRELHVEDRRHVLDIARVPPRRC